MKQGLLRWRIFRHFRMHYFTMAIWKQWRAAIVTELGTKQNSMAKHVLYSGLF
jgi:hypothetical protein